MDHYEYTDIEQRRIDEILGTIQSHGGLFQCDRMGGLVLANGQQIPIPFEVVHGKRYCIDPHGRVWRYAAAGSPKSPNAPGGGGVPRRINVVEMWSGHWRKMIDPDGKPSYAKNLIWCSVTAGVNEHPNISHIEWYMARKGFKHPFDPPHAPTKFQLRVLERKAAETDNVIFARIDELTEQHGGDAEKVKEAFGLTPPPTPAPKPRPKPKRTNKRRKKPNATGS